MNMNIRDENVEYMSKHIGERYRATELAGRFIKIGIPQTSFDYPGTKWVMVKQAFSHCLDAYPVSPERLMGIIELAVHPINFSNDSAYEQKRVLEDFNSRLKFDGLRIVEGEKGFYLEPISRSKKPKTKTEYIAEIVNFFREEYNKVRIPGMSYEYVLGSNPEFDANKYNLDDSSDAFVSHVKDIDRKKQILEELKTSGFIISLSFDTSYKGDSDEEFLIAKCFLNEKMLLNDVEASDRNVDSVVKRVVHEHSHKFENSIQDKPIALNFNKDNVSGKFPYKIPSGTKWENITMSVLDDDSAEIRIAGHVHTTGFADMGFVDKRSGKPNDQWVFLKLLARKGGSLPPSDGDAKDKYKKQKEILVKRLRSYFGLEFDPFKTYDRENGYSLKMTIFMPEVNEDKAGSSDSGISGEIDQMFSSLSG